MDKWLAVKVVGSHSVALMAAGSDARGPDVFCKASDAEALRKDAERYRKLRDGAFVSAPMVVDPFNHDVTYTEDGLDAALDALPAVGAA